MSLELPCSKNEAECNHYISLPTSQQIWKKSEAQGGGDDGSLMGCIVLFLYLKRLKPLMILVERESQWCFNYSGPSINHGLCVWQLNPAKTNTGAPRPSQSTGWAQQPWSQHTRCTWTPLRSPAATRSATKGRKIAEEAADPNSAGKKMHSGTEQIQRQTRRRF